MLVASQEQSALLQFACALNHQAFALLYLELYNWVVEYKLLLEFTGSKYQQSIRFIPRSKKQGGKTGGACIQGWWK